MVYSVHFLHGICDFIKLVDQGGGKFSLAEIGVVMANIWQPIGEVVLLFVFIHRVFDIPVFI